MDEMNTNDELYRKEILLSAGKYEKIYRKPGTESYADYPYFDKVNGQHYKIKILDVTDEEFAQIEASVKNGQDESCKTFEQDTRRSKEKEIPEGNVGKRIMGLATAICTLGIIAACVIGIYFMSLGEDFVITGLLIAVFGSLGAWISTWFMSAFGQLVDDTHVIREKLEKD